MEEEAMSNANILRQTAEELYQKELDALMAAETDPHRGRTVPP